MGIDYNEYAIEYEDYFGEPPGDVMPDEAIEKTWEDEEYELYYAKERQKRRNSGYAYSQRKNTPVSSISEFFVIIIVVLTLSLVFAPVLYLDNLAKTDYRHEVKIDSFVMVEGDPNTEDDNYYEITVRNKKDYKIEHLAVMLKIDFLNDYYETYTKEFSLKPNETKVIRTKKFKFYAKEFNEYYSGDRVYKIKSKGIRDMRKYENTTKD